MTYEIEPEYTQISAHSYFTSATIHVNKLIPLNKEFEYMLAGKLLDILHELEAAVYSKELDEINK